MLEPLRHILEKKKIILASSSPSRKEALKNIGFPEKSLTVIDPEADETEDRDRHKPKEYVEIIAKRKVDAVEERLLREGKSFDLIIGADTIVFVNERIRNKPNKENQMDAFQMVKSLSGRSNEVYTGVVLKQPGRPHIVFTDKTTVYFGEMTDEQIQAYIKTGEPFNCAGGYAIQGLGGTFIERIDGNYFTVLGLPVYKLCKKICEIFADDH